MNVFTESGYRTSRAPNGDLIIHDVEIFCETERDGAVFDVVWLRHAFNYAMQQQQDRYLPPLHVKHHAPGNDVKACGKFQIKKLKQIPYKGQNVAALIADLFVNCKETEEALMLGKFPYRSVELTDPAVAQIDGLALLDHDAPYLELPMLMTQPVGAGATDVSYETLFQGYRVTACSNDPGMMTCFSKTKTRSTFVLFDMPIATQKPVHFQDESFELSASDDVGTSGKVVGSTSPRRGYTFNELEDGTIDLFDSQDKLVDNYPSKAWAHQAAGIIDESGGDPSVVESKMQELSDAIDISGGLDPVVDRSRSGPMESSGVSEFAPTSSVAPLDQLHQEIIAKKKEAKQANALDEAAEAAVSGDVDLATEILNDAGFSDDEVVDFFGEMNDEIPASAGGEKGLEPEVFAEPEAAQQAADALLLDEPEMAADVLRDAGYNADQINSFIEGDSTALDEGPGVGVGGQPAETPIHKLSEIEQLARESGDSVEEIEGLVEQANDMIAGIIDEDPGITDEGIREQLDLEFGEDIASLANVEEVGDNVRSMIAGEEAAVEGTRESELIDPDALEAAGFPLESMTDEEIALEMQTLGEDVGMTDEQINEEIEQYFGGDPRSDEVKSGADVGLDEPIDLGEDEGEGKAGPSGRRTKHGEGGRFVEGEGE
jgi:hypothetical protein